MPTGRESFVHWNLGDGNVLPGICCLPVHPHLSPAVLRVRRYRGSTICLKTTAPCSAKWRYIFISSQAVSIVVSIVASATAIGFTIVGYGGFVLSIVLAASCALAIFRSTDLQVAAKWLLLSCVLSIAGQLVQVLLSGRCGGGAYRAGTLRPNAAKPSCPLPFDGIDNSITMPFTIFWSWLQRC